MFIIIKILSEQQGHIWSNIKQSGSAARQAK